MGVSPATILSLSLTIPPPSFFFSGDTLRFNRYVFCNQSFSRPDRLGLVVAEKPSRRRWTFCFKCRNRRGNGYPKSEALEEGEDFVVVNFYRFVSIEDPEAEISNHLSFLQDLNIRGRIYLNEQGINAQYSGPSKDALAYVEWIKEDERFSDILVQMSPAINGHAFPKLKLQNKPSLVQYEGGISQLPLLDPPMRAKPLEPSEWKRKLKDLTDNDEASSSSGGRSCILLDVRNGLLKPAEVFGGDRHFFILIGYEWDVGHFRGACRPEVDCFRNTTFGLSDEKEVPSDPLINVDKENTDILMYCTGGIRCDVYSTVLRQRGFKNLYTLKGGVSHYLEEEGTTEWVGNLFVFDSRLSLPPAAYSNNTMDEEATPTPETTVDTSFARCYICDSQIQELRHRNCANLDCNLLFLCCAECVVDMKGCCCSSCIIAPRLRPVLNGIKRYEKWHVYRDS